MNELFIADRIKEFKDDPESVYNTWFLNNNDRLKAFRTIRNGLTDVIDHIEQRTFGNDYKGSTLEFIMSAICEQKQVFDGAAHAFYWKPKLRIPDIYENEANQLAFGRFLKAVLHTSQEKQLLGEIHRLDSLQIKGLGPAVANILYFLHPTLFPPFNTAIVRGYNDLLGQKIKLGSWSEYLDMRAGLIDMNECQRSLLSKDLGAIGGFMFEIGSGRLIVSGNAERVLETDAAKREKSSLKRHQEVLSDYREESEHSEMQYHLAKLGRSLGYKVWIAQNDHKRQWNNKTLGELSLPALPLLNVPKAASDTISFIDVLWLDAKDCIISAFEVEKSTSIYSGILRLHDLALSLNHPECHLFLITPDSREKEVQAQLLRPSLQQDKIRNLSYVLFSDLRCDCDAMCKYGRSVEVLEKITRRPAAG
ncbi:hypothetical protein [Paenibacillus pedocola]|uniref:hypothetical protein n=1 Tax=Paenibacillus pedocola TaxID=3242193 RepID=UPI0028775B6C|nr:hypothetical protein [Paenibacillus typhae]